MTQATRQQVEDMYGLFEDMKASRYCTGVSRIADDCVVSALRGMVEPNGLMDAVIVKITRPDTPFEDFDAIAALDGRSTWNVFENLHSIMLPSDYDVSHAIARSFLQDIPALFEDFACLIQPSADRAGAYRIAASISYLEGDSAARCKHFADLLFRVKPEDEMLRNLSAALIHGIEPNHRTGTDGPDGERERPHTDTMADTGPSTDGHTVRR